MAKRNGGNWQEALNEKEFIESQWKDLALVVTYVTSCGAAPRVNT